MRVTARSRLRHSSDRCSARRRGRSTVRRSSDLSVAVPSFARAACETARAQLRPARLAHNLLHDRNKRSRLCALTCESVLLLPAGSSQSLSPDASSACPAICARRGLDVCHGPCFSLSLGNRYLPPVPKRRIFRARSAVLSSLR